METRSGPLDAREIGAVHAGVRAWQLLSESVGTPPELVQMAGGARRLTWDELDSLAARLETGTADLPHVPLPAHRGSRCACGALVEVHAYAHGVGWVCPGCRTFDAAPALGIVGVGAWGRDLARVYAAAGDGPIAGVHALARELRRVLRIEDEEADRAAWRLMESAQVLPPAPEGCCHGAPIVYGVLQSWRCPLHAESSVESQPHLDPARADAGERVYVCWDHRASGILAESGPAAP